VTAARRVHARRRRAIHLLSLVLARHPSLIAFARMLAGRRRTRFGRIALFLDYVHRLAAAEAARGADRSLREDDLAVAVLSALLRASGERASIEYTREAVFVRVAVTRADVGELPPWARLMRGRQGAVEIALVPSARWRPAGYLAPEARPVLERRDPAARLVARAS
jgi:hypothetical protein